MGMVVRTNINSMNANRNLSKNNNLVSKSIEKLASGYAINRAADDASGLAVSEKMRAQIDGLNQGTSNTLEGIGLVQTAEGAMNEIHNMLNRMVELATKSANGTICDEVDREAIQAEVDVLVNEIDRIAESTNFNGIPLLMGMDTNTLVDTFLDLGKLNETPKISTTYFGTGSYLSSASYRSDTVTLASDTSNNLYSTYVPADADLPYTISFEVVAYNESDSTEGSGSIIESKTYSITVNENGQVIGSNGTNYSTKPNYTTSWDNNQFGDPTTDPPYPANPFFPGEGYCYAGNNSDGSYLSEDQVKLIMEDLMDNASFDLALGGYEAIATPSRTDFPELYPYYPTSSVIVYPEGKTASDYVSGSTLGVVSNSTTDGIEYNHNSGMYIIGPTVSSTGELSTTEGHTNVGRVLGVVSTVTSGSASVSVGSPKSTGYEFDSSSWISGVDVNNVPSGTFLGVSSKSESLRSELTVSAPLSSASISGLSDEQIQALISSSILTINRYDTDYPDYPEGYPGQYMDPEYRDVIRTQGYISVTSDFPLAYLDFLGDSVTVIVGESSDEDHHIIDKLCAQISKDFTATDNTSDDWYSEYVTTTNEPTNAYQRVEGQLRVERKNDVNEDVPTDKNVTNLYTIVMSSYTNATYTWEETPVYEETWEILEDPIILQVADQNEEYNRVAVYIDPMTGEALEIKPLYVDTEEEAQAAIEKILNAINYVSENRADLGAIQNRLERIINVNNNTSENMTSARSVIKDCDMAKEMMQYTKMDVLTQSAQSMLAQSNQSMEQVLSLLG